MGHRVLAASIILSAALASAARGQPASVRRDPSDWLRERRTADSLLAAQSYAPAESLYRHLATQDSTDVQLWVGLGTAASSANRFAQAESAFKHVFANGYFPGPVATQIARMAARQGKKSEALDWLDSALAHRVTSRASFARDSAFNTYHTDARFRTIAGMLPARHFTRDEGWRYDIAFFASEARRVHTGYDRPAFSKPFADAVASLSARVPTMSDAEIVAGLQRIATLLHDGHSGVYRRTLPGHRKRLPVDFYWFDDGLYIVGARDDHKDLIGAHVVKLGALPEARVLGALAPYVPRDNPQRITGFGVPVFLSYPLQLQAMGAVSDTAGAALTIVDRAGSSRSVMLAGDDTRLPQSRLTPRDTGGANPLWLRHVAANIWSSPLESGRALYVQYNAVADAPNLTLAAFASQLHDQLEAGGARDLIVDVRRNGGGNSLLNAPLHQAIFAYAADSVHHHVWVLIGRHTFSAAQNFVNYIERFTNAVFVGEPTGSAPNFTGENGEVILPYSGVVAEISNENHQSAFWEDQRPWIAPTVPIVFTSADYFANRDPVLDGVLHMIEGRP